MEDRPIKSIKIIILGDDERKSFLKWIRSEYPNLVVKNPQRETYDLDIIIKGKNDLPIDGFASYCIRCWLWNNLLDNSYSFSQYDYDDKLIILNKEDVDSRRGK